jgi:hypothetical protein
MRKEQIREINSNASWRTIWIIAFANFCVLGIWYKTLYVPQADFSTVDLKSV